MVHFHEGVDHVQHAVANAGAQVEHLAALLTLGVVHGSHMTLCQVNHMDVVPDTGAVVGGVVVAEDAQLLPAANGGLGDEGHQVVGNAPGVLAQQTGLVGTDGVKVPQQNHAPLGVGVGNAGENLLGHILGPAVGVGAAAGAAGFLQRHFVVGGINGGRGGEDDGLHVEGLHHLGQHQGRVQVVVVVFPGLGNALTHSLETGEVNDAVNLVFLEDGGQQCFVPHIALVEFHLFAGELLHPLQGLGVGVAQIINDHYLMAAFQQLDAGVCADVPGTAGDKNIHKKTS